MNAAVKGTNDMSKTATAKTTERVKAGTSKAEAEKRRKLFVEAYVANGGNATQAAISAGYSEKTADQQGSRLLRDVKVSSDIALRAREVADRYGLTTELAARSIVQELTFDPAKLFDAEGRLKPVTELDEDTRMALASIEFEQVGSKDAPVFVRKVKWANRAQAREQLMKHLGMFKEVDPTAVAAAAGAAAGAAVAKALDFNAIRERARRAASE